MAKKIKHQFPLLGDADELVEQLRRLIPKVVKQSKPADIHTARVATRRLKAVLDVLNPVLSGRDTKSFRKVLKDLRHGLGSLRDADVMFEHLTDIKLPRLNSGKKWLLAQLQHDREKIRDETAKEIHPAKMLARLGSWWGVREQIIDCREAVNTLLAESVHLQLDAFIERAEALINNRPAKVDDTSAQNPHQLRIVAKKLRYALEMAIVEKHELHDELISAFKEMQDALGLWHDYVVLTDSALKASREETLFMQDGSLQLLVLEVAQLSMRTAMRNLEQFQTVWNKRGEKLASAIRNHFPLTRQLEAEPTRPPADRGQPR